MVAHFLLQAEPLNDIAANSYCLIVSFLLLSKTTTTNKHTTTSGRLLVYRINGEPENQTREMTEAKRT